MKEERDREMEGGREGERKREMRLREREERHIFKENQIYE